MKDLTYSFQLSIEQDRESILEVSVGAEDTAESVAKAKGTILKLLDSFTPQFEAAPVPDTPPQTTPQMPEKTAETSREPAPNSGVKGCVLLNCEQCGHVFRTFLKAPQRSLTCKCGHHVDLTAPLASFSYTCEVCGRKNWGKTNIEDASIELRCSCGDWAVLEWSPEDKMYQLPKKNGRETFVDVLE